MELSELSTREYQRPGANDATSLVSFAKLQQTHPSREQGPRIYGGLIALDPCCSTALKTGTSLKGHDNNFIAINLIVVHKGNVELTNITYNSIRITNPWRAANACTSNLSREHMTLKG